MRLKKRERLMYKYKLFIVILGLVTLIVLYGGFKLSGSPISQKNDNLDELRMSNFSSIKYSIDDYFRKESKLPENVKILPSNNRLADPKTGREIEYYIVNKFQYKLCTEFATDTFETYYRTKQYPSYVGSFDSNSQSLHRKGYYCISYNIPAYLAKPTPTISRIPTSRPQDKIGCPGYFENDECILPSGCIDYDYLDYFKRAAIIYKNPDDTGLITVFDRCTEDGKQVIENSCHIDPAKQSEFIHEENIYNCPYGCDDGACRRSSYIEPTIILR